MPHLSKQKKSKNNKLINNAENNTIRMKKDIDKTYFTQFNQNTKKTKLL